MSKWDVSSVTGMTSTYVYDMMSGVFYDVKSFNDDISYIV